MADEEKNTIEEQTQTSSDNQVSLDTNGELESLPNENKEVGTIASDNNNLNIEPEDIGITQKKASRFSNKILFIIAGILVFIILILATLFFMGVFDKEELPPEVTDEAEQTQVTQEIVQLPSYTFALSDINVPRLNSKLETLLNETINIDETNIKEAKNTISKNTNNNESFYDDELEALFDEKEIKKDEPMVVEEKPSNIDEELLMVVEIDDLEDITNSQPTLEVAIDTVEIIDDTQTKTFTENNVDMKNTDTKNTDTKNTDTYDNQKFLKFVQVATLKYKLYTQFLRDIKAVDARISICQNNNGRIQIFIGPFIEDSKRKFVIEQINKSVVTDAFGIEFTQEEYYKRCGINDPS